MLQKVKNLFLLLNAKGLAIPLLRDPKTGSASLSMTLTVISFLICACGEIGKLTKILDGVDLQQANYLFVTCAALYFSRGFVSSNNGKDINISKDNQ